MILGWRVNLGWQDHRSSTSSGGNCLWSASRALFTAHFGEFGNNCQNDTLSLTQCPCWPAVELWPSARHLLAVIACHLHLALPRTNSACETSEQWWKCPLFEGTIFESLKIIVSFILCTAAVKQICQSIRSSSTHLRVRDAQRVQRFYCHTRTNAISLYLVRKGSTKVYWTYLLYMCCVYSALLLYIYILLYIKYTLVQTTLDFKRSDKQCIWFLNQSNKSGEGLIPKYQPGSHQAEWEIWHLGTNLSLTRFKRIRPLANVALKK